MNPATLFTQGGGSSASSTATSSAATGAISFGNFGGLSFPPTTSALNTTTLIEVAIAALVAGGLVWLLLRKKG